MASPTFFLADILKKDLNKNKAIRILNWFYFTISLISFAISLLLQHYHSIFLQIPDKDSYFIFSLWIILLLSRCSEIFYSFLLDAYDKVSEKRLLNISFWPQCIVSLKNKLVISSFLSRVVDGEDLKFHDRLVLSFRSYFEIVINFSFLYLLTPCDFWKGNHIPHDIMEALYFSGVTITTLGYGDISPINWFPQFLTVFEVFCGVSLLVVCFAVYLRNENS